MEPNSTLNTWESAEEYFQGKWDNFLDVTGKYKHKK